MLQDLTESSGAFSRLKQILYFNIISNRIWDRKKVVCLFPFSRMMLLYPQFRGTVASLFPNISKSVMGLASLWKQFLWLGVVFHNVQRVPVDVTLALRWGAWTSYRKWFCIIYHAEYWLWRKDSHKKAVNSCPPFTKIKFSTH